MKTAALISTVLLSTAVSAQAQKPTTGYAPVNGLKMYYEIHGSGSGEPLVLLHGSYMTISSNWTEWIGEFSKTRKVIAVEMQGHGGMADINRDFSYENLATKAPFLFIHGDADGVRDWTTSLKCSASRAMRFLATCGRARNPGWPFYRTRHTLR